tara:strand:- start:706 stop:1818 length:1113 start_codon:yes stop_codon:yes gene_type:complete
MRKHEIKYRNKSEKYSIFIGENSINLLPKKIKLLCPETKKVALIIDKNLPSKYKKKLKKILRGYNPLFLSFKANEKNKSLSMVEYFLNILLSKNFNRSDLIIGVGGGITGDLSGFVANIFKRGINFINIPTTLLAQVDSAVGGKTGVNTLHGKNLVGSFNQPKLVLIDTTFINSLPKREMICGFAEILKHSIIKDKNFFNWLEKNTSSIFAKDTKSLIYAIKKSCQIKMYFVSKDVHEKNTRMILNFGHTFAHAIEAKNKYTKKISHGEAVLIGMILATKLSILKKICKVETLSKIMKIYTENNLNYILKNITNHLWLESLIPYFKNDKKNNDENINFLLLKKIGATELPNSFKISIKSLKRYLKIISQY